MNGNKTLLIDGMNLAYRCRYAFAVTHPRTAEDLSVKYGFVRTVVRLIDEHHPTSIVVCWDGGRSSRRVAQFTGYKSTRQHDAGQVEFIYQVDLLREALGAFGVVNVRQHGVEADDLLYHASRVLDGACLIVSTDGDLLQAVTRDERVSVLNPANDRLIAWGSFEELIGVHPTQYVDYKIMLGDPSDSIQGVVGIGKKSAALILRLYGSIEAAILSVEQGDDRLPTRVINCLRQADVAHISTVRALVDLTADQDGAAALVKESINKWQGSDRKAILDFMIDNAFIGHLDGVVPAFCGLRQPVINGISDAPMLIIK